MTLRELYRSVRIDGPEGDTARQLVNQTHWFTANAVFDPKTGEARPQALSEFLAKFGNDKPGLRRQDRLHRIVEHARPAVERLFRFLNESPRREHALMPVRAVRELDAASFIKLSTRPGRNIREKLAGKPYLEAVRRFQSVNLPENRLLKAYLSRLAELLELRRICIDEPEDELLPRIRLWLFSNEARAIGNWENHPPNNTLLAHRDYRRVWDSWRRLQTLDEDIARDLSRLDERQQTMTRWMEFGRMYRGGAYLFAEMPVLFDYEDFSIQAWLPEPLTTRSARKVSRSHDRRLVTESACVDLLALHPRYATPRQNHMALADRFLWQQWSSKSGPVDITLFDSDAACLHPDSVTIASSDLFFGSNKDSAHCDRAARAFAARLRETFRGEKLSWLIPDALNDFELETIRRNLNARFQDAEPLPRSVAAVFQQVDYSEITGEGYSVVVVDQIGGTTCATTLIAKRDSELAQRLPRTKGFYWERCPPLILTRTEETDNSWSGHIPTVDQGGKWMEPPRPLIQQRVEASALKNDVRIGQFAKTIQVTKSPVAGGLLLDAMQARAGDIPLWRDQIPELSIKVMKDGRYQRFYLVARGRTIKPIRGLPVQIPIAERFTLPAGKRFYQFPLYQGENAAELRFAARLDSPAFPLKANTECELILTFRYGDDDPYNLVFVPLDRSFPPVRATWQQTIEGIVTDSPAPDYPNPLSWDELRSWHDAQGNEVDLVEWLTDSLERLIELVPRRRSISINSSWRAKTDNNGNEYWFAFATTDDGEKCYCNSKSFVTPTDEDLNARFPSGTKVYGNIIRQRGGLAASDISAEHAVRYSNDAKQRIVSFRERSLQNRMSTIWADGRSFMDARCPTGFKGDLDALITALLDALPSDIVGRKMMFLLACLHKDTSDACIRWVSDQVENRRIRDPRAVGFVLGDVSQEWQQHIFDRLASHPGNDAIGVFAYAIWRERHFVERFSLSELEALLNALAKRMERIRPLRIAKNGGNEKWARRDWARATAEPLELLLGLLRTRSSDDPEIRMLIQPHQAITKQFAEQIDRVEEIVAESNITLFSRVQIDVQKPEGVRSPDLLYALRLYLTGDDGANAVHITGISDADGD
jgi:hypothetical protein